VGAGPFGEKPKVIKEELIEDLKVNAEVLG
jgi:hypothetical protein